jgi:predicted nucleotidyltransferase
MSNENNINNPKLVLIKESLLPFVQEYGIVKAYVFGSFAREEDTDQSDVDFLIEFDKDFDMIEFFRLKNRLEEILTRKVDIVETKSINPIFKESILKDTILLYSSS